MTKVHPVVAVPPCQTCKGKGYKAHDQGHLFNCPDCKGSGLDTLIPASEIRVYIAQRKDPLWKNGLLRWLDERRSS